MTRIAPLRYAPFRMQVEVPRMLLVFVTLVLGYALMLITMTYVVVRLSRIAKDTANSAGLLLRSLYRHGCRGAVLWQAIPSL